ncbi:MAG: stress response translation initiation inhibitor YciH [Candidatus Woesearchaeota archaeon]|jgi:translation initiation factor 1|nr:stress response translation initiation inhibitor YciH [Candidatus Woesearchaeota archaeon]MDP7324333.1 stress response translation initiation inhibitor YciH [Candidatus Woesearchaeota archaeon]MDP7457947.1 stress response translation initiation inhibitor YciH [Candidatus Woesearchaeota archaeon]
MPEIDPITGLPKELGVWENITKESQKIVIRTEAKKFGKKYTIIEGIDDKEVNLKDVGKKLKSFFACGGTVKDGNVELQGDHKVKVREKLIQMGFAPETIEIK